MTATFLSLILFLTFLTLSGFHFYWLFGGTWGLKSVIPSKGSEPNLIAIPQFATLIVAMGLLLFGLLYLQKSGLKGVSISIDFDLLTNYGYWIIPAIFTIRALGEFKYVGFFKKVKHTQFAKADTKIFAPLCLGIGIIGFIIQLLN